MAGDDTGRNFTNAMVSAARQHLCYMLRARPCTGIVRMGGSAVEELLELKLLQYEIAVSVRVLVQSFACRNLSELEQLESSSRCRSSRTD